VTRPDNGVDDRHRRGPAGYGGLRGSLPVQFFVAAAGFGMVCVGSGSASDKRYRRASIAMTLAAASFGAWAALLAPMGNGVI
jgi:hypothetical protein